MTLPLDVAEAELNPCAKLPVHTPGGIQPFGALLALDDSFQVRQFSENVADYLKRPLTELFGLPLREFLGFEAERSIRSAFDTLAPGVVLDLGLLPNEAAPWAGLRQLIHHHDGVKIVELISETPLSDRPDGPDFDDLDPNLLAESLSWGASRMMSPLPVEAFAEELVQRIRGLTGFDRVLTLRFDKDWHGEVIAESKRDDLEAYIGLRYPSTDIPPQVRAMYILNKVRVLSDASRETIPLVPVVNPITLRHLDLTYARLRSVSPFHRAYSINMGPIAYLVASIVVEGKLSGLIICHNERPTFYSGPKIQFLNGVAELIAAKIALSESRTLTHGILLGQELLKRLPKGPEPYSSWAEGLIAPEAKVMETFKADGLAVLDGRVVYKRGLLPADHHIRRVGEWLDRSGEQLFITRQLGIDNSEFAEFAATASGLVAIRIPHSKGNWVMWFRPEEAETVSWAGDPRTTMRKDEKEGTLSPRKSFERWLEMVRGKSRPWDSLELAMAGDAIRTNLLQVLVSWQERRIADLATYYSILFLQANDAVIVMDCSLKVKFWNEAATQVFGNTAAEMLGTHLLDRYEGKKRQELETRLRNVLQGPEFVGDWQDVYKDGSLIWVHTRTQCVRGENGELLGLMRITRDISDLKNAEQRALNLAMDLERRVEERTHELAVANAALAKSARLKDEFLANMSHELRTPLNGVLALSESLQEQVYGPLNQEQLEALHDIEQSGRHLLALINDILDLSKVESGHMTLRFTSVSMEGLCQSALRFVKELAQKKNQRVTLSIDASVSTIIIDERRVKQILVNLLSNAVKFTADRGEIGLAVTGDREREVVEFRVWDTGIGISPDQMHLLFKPFQQIDSRLSREYSGTGLGLALVAKMAELHGGSVTLESQLGKGSSFTVALPWKQGGEQAPFVAAKHFPVHRVLILGGSQGDVSRLNRYLDELNIQSNTVPWPADDFERIRADRPDLIFLDIESVGGGWDALGALKAHENLRSIPVIIVSVLDEAAQVRAMGAADFLVKPFDREALYKALSGIDVPRTNSSSVSVATEAYSTEKPLILLAEDNPVSFRALADFLNASGYSVESAHDGGQAVAKARQLKPRLILMDIQMPTIDGIEAMRQLRLDPQTREIPIIAITALAMAGDRERCLEAGANDYLAKPLSLKILRSTIERLIPIHPPAPL